jgi:hypothetical protein
VRQCGLDDLQRRRGLLPTAAVQVGAPPPSDDSARDALAGWINDGDLLGGGGSVLGQIHIG